VEAALSEVISLVAGHMDVLPVATRVDVLRRLWPMIALLQSPTDRTTAFATSWSTALEMHLQASEAAAKGAAGSGRVVAAAGSSSACWWLTCFALPIAAVFSFTNITSPLRLSPSAHPPGIEVPDGMLLQDLLSDPFIQDVINRKGAPTLVSGLPLGPTSPGAGAGSEAAGDGGAPRSSLETTSYNPAAAGATGASARNPAAAGPTGASTISSIDTSVGGGGGAAGFMGVGTPRTSESGMPSSELCGRGVVHACSGNHLRNGHTHTH